MLPVHVWDRGSSLASWVIKALITGVSCRGKCIGHSSCREEQQQSRRLSYDTARSELKIIKSYLLRSVQSFFTSNHCRVLCASLRDCKSCEKSSQEKHYINLLTGQGLLATNKVPNPDQVRPGAPEPQMSKEAHSARFNFHLLVSWVMSSPLASPPGERIICEKPGKRRFDLSVELTSTSAS